MIKVDFIINKGFKWYNKNNIFVKGFLFDSNQHYYEKEELIHYFKEVKNKNDLLNKISNSNGLFTIFIQLSNSEFLLANDIIRSFPIFYYSNNKDIHLSDNYNSLLHKFRSKKIDPVSKIEFQSAGFVSGHNTLLNNINITQSGEILSFNNSKLNIEPYFNYFTSEINSSNKDVLVSKSKEIIDKTFERLVKSLNNRMAVIPLSGGLDSRLIACKLKELGYTNILCYTFGKSFNNPEKITSEKVAKKLGLDWIFIEYNPDNIGKYITDQQFKEYYEFYTQYSSSFMFQDYFAVKYLKENKMIPDDAVFIPGYSGDFLGGSQLYKNGRIKYNSSTNNIAKKIVDNRYINTKLSTQDKKEIIKKIRLQLNNSINNNHDLLAYTIFENWEIKENLSKFIGQTTRIYDFFEYEFRLPFWDKELVDFFKYIPYHYKYGKTLYDEILKSYFMKFDVNYSEGISISPKEFTYYKFKQLIKQFIPNLLLKKLTNKPDILNYNLILSDIKKELNKSKDFNENIILSHNAYIAHWYLKQIEKNSNAN